MSDEGPRNSGRSRAKRTALILALVALGFYVAAFLVRHWK
jgi:hypothetical protein